MTATKLTTLERLVLYLLERGPYSALAMPKHLRGALRKGEKAGVLERVPSDDKYVWRVKDVYKAKRALDEHDAKHPKDDAPGCQLCAARRLYATQDAYNAERGNNGAADWSGE